MRGLVAAVVTACVVVLSASAAIAAQDGPPIVVTTGSATVAKAPDVAFVTVAVETRAKSPRDAQRQNADLMTAVGRKLSDLSVPADARRTIGVRLEQEYDNTNGRRTPRDYLARNTMEVRVDDIAKTGEIADACVQAGATAVDGIRFDLKNRADAEHEAIRQAVADARGRAEAAAAGANRTLDRILKIEDAERPIAVPRAMSVMRSDVSTPVEPGLIEVRASVTLTVSMK
ncbi:MAG TPA: SIMPL domain-containing protein [Vicinamibacterales bacterium]